MARIHNCKNQLKIKYEKLVRRRRFLGQIICIILTVLSFRALIYAVRNPWELLDWISDFYWEIASNFGSFVGVLMWLTQGIRVGVWLFTYPLLAYVIFSCISRLRRGDHGRESQEEAILRAGLEGEEKLHSILTHLPDCCHVFTNVNIPWRDRHGNSKNSETDAIVISPSGIFIVEAKNYQGRVCGNVADENLMQKKYRGEKLISQKEIYNPVKQVKTHARAFAYFLRENGLTYNIKTCVFFSNEDVELELEGGTDTYSDCPIFAANDLRGFGSFFYFKYRCIYSDKELEQVLQVMEKLIQEPDNSD